MLYFASDFDEFVSDAFMVSLHYSDLILKELNFPLNHADLALDLTHLQTEFHDFRQCSFPDGLGVIRACLKLLQARVDSIEPRVDSIEPRVDSIEPRVDGIEPDVKGIEPGEYPLFE